MSHRASDRALLGLLILFSIIFGGFLLMGLIYYVWFIIELAAAASWVAIPIGIAGMIYLILSSLAMQSK